MGKSCDNLLQEMPDTKAEYRERTEMLRRRINLLNGKDKLLMTMYLDNNNSIRQISRLSGIDETSISRRINRIVKRLTEDKYIICLRNRNKLTTTEKAITKEYFLLGMSIKNIAKRRRWTYYQAYKTIQKIQQQINRSQKTEIREQKSEGRRI